MAQACPINFTTVDNTVSRINSLQTLLIVGLFFVTSQPVWLYLLAIDLMIRLHGNKQLSPVYQLSNLLKKLTGLPTQNVDGASKKVAGHFGLLFVLLLIAAAHLGLHAASTSIAAVYALCLLMDVALNFCVGCKVYYLYRFVVK